MDTIKRLPTHPGDILKEELECRRISQKKFSEILGFCINDRSRSKH